MRPHSVFFLGGGGVQCVIKCIIAGSETKWITPDNVENLLTSSTQSIQLTAHAVASCSQFLRIRVCKERLHCYDVNPLNKNV